MSIVNYLASRKTHIPASCSLSCCGNAFGVIRKPKGSRAKTSPSRLMRRYAKHADNRIWRREVREELTREYAEYEDAQDAYYRRNFENLLDDDNYYDYQEDRYSCYDDGFDYRVEPLPDHRLDAVHNAILNAYMDGVIDYQTYVDVTHRLNTRD